MSLSFCLDHPRVSSKDNQLNTCLIGKHDTYPTNTTQTQQYGIASNADPTSYRPITNNDQVHHLDIRNKEWLEATTSIIIITKNCKWLPTTGIITYCWYYLEGGGSSYSAATASMLNICALGQILALLLYVHLSTLYAIRTGSISRPLHPVQLRPFVHCLLASIIHISLSFIYCFDILPLWLSLSLFLVFVLIIFCECSHLQTV